jgi:hypothetical protein
LQRGELQLSNGMRFKKLKNPGYVSLSSNMHMMVPWGYRMLAFVKQHPTLWAKREMAGFSSGT